MNKIAKDTNNYTHNVMNDLIDRARNEKLIFTFDGKEYFLDHVDSYQHGEDFGLFFRGVDEYSDRRCMEILGCELFIFDDKDYINLDSFEDYEGWLSF
ncbi:hypothetical protein HXS02_001578 [Campylobacter coli]|nr:hypothetical protein [Campylobacter coli]